jgi:hypothetical protein
MKQEVRGWIEAAKAIAVPTRAGISGIDSGDLMP